MIDYLKCIKTGTVMKYNKSKCLGATDAAHPAAYGHFLIQKGFPVCVNFFYSCKFHNLFPLSV